MSSASSSLSRRLSHAARAIVLVAVAAVFVAGGVDPAAAAKRKRSAENPRYAAIVIDANTGKTLFAANADAARYPASLTKMMTLYLTFEALKAGKIDKETRVPFSAQAAAEPPTKLGVRAGGSVSVETIIYSLVTKSANDSATAMGELLGGSSQNFARMMTAKARQLGMDGTVFRNAHGLPNPDQHTTARDMAKLGIALREHFPQDYAYFSTSSFKWGKQRIGNHNRLLGRVKGVDGIKTGYTRASGFNLVSSVNDGNRKIVAVVMGGTSGGARDAHMAQLIKTYLPAASTKDRGGDLIAKSESPIRALANAILPKRNAPKPQMKPQREPDVAVALSPERVIPERVIPERVIEEPEQVAAVVPFGNASDSPAEIASPVVEQGYAEPIPERMGGAIDPVRTASIPAPAGWAVQVASSPSEAEAQAFLSRTNKQASNVLASASGFTVPFEKGGVTYYRARFGGFESKTAAWDACNALKKKKISCYAVQQ